MATVTNWIDHLNKPAEEVAGAVYPGAGSSEGLLVILAMWCPPSQLSRRCWRVGPLRYRLPLVGGGSGPRAAPGRADLVTMG